jgi:hypothetical protein
MSFFSNLFIADEVVEFPEPVHGAHYQAQIEGCHHRDDGKRYRHIVGADLSACRPASFRSSYVC